MKTCPEENNAWVHLTSAGNDIELGIVASLLEMAQIPFISKSIGIDKFVGVPMAGIDILVPVDRYEEAQQLLNTEIDEDSFMDEETESGNVNDQ